MKIAIVGTGYVGLSLSVLLSKNNKVIAYDLDKQKVDLINKKISPIRDKEINNFLQNESLKLTATTDKDFAFRDSEFIIIATPTDYDVITGYFDTSSVEKTINDVFSINPKATIIIKSTIPIGYITSARKKYKNNKIIFSPEFLREGHALHDNLYPSRIIVGDTSEEARVFANMLTKPALKKDIPILYTGPDEAEAIKLYSNSYLAMRISYFNEIDSFCEIKGLNAKQVIEGVCSDSRIRDGYNNPSFGYGGYCLPKDTKQLLANYKDIPQHIIGAIVSSNDTRMDHISSQIIKKRPKKVGIYRLIMKSNSDNFRESSIISIIDRIKRKKIEVVIYEPLLIQKGRFEFLQCQVVDKLQKFKKESDLIVSNRITDELHDVKNKTYSRDLFNRD